MRRLTPPLVLSAACATALVVSGCGGSGAQPKTASALPDGARTAAPKDGRPSGSGPQLRVRPSEGTESAKLSGPVGAGGKAGIRDLRIASYDRESGTAVLTRRTRDGGTAPARVRAGAVVASPPTAAAPKGALVKITEVHGSTDRGTEVRTRPAELTDLFGDATAAGSVPIDPADWRIKPLLDGVKVQRGSGGGSGGGSGDEGAARASRTRREKAPDADALRLSVGTPAVAGQLPDTAEPPETLSGYLEFDPDVAFSYERDGAGPGPSKASVRLSGSLRSGWEVNATLKQTVSPVHVPLAKVAAYPVIMVGGVPVVVAVAVTFYLDVMVTGEVTVRYTQDVTGEMTVGASYTRDGGWKPDVHAETRPGPATVEPRVGGSLDTGITPEVTVGLYDAVGVAASVTPFVGAKVMGPWGERPDSWNLHYGVSVDGALFARLSIFGSAPFEARIPIPIWRREWPIAEGTFPPAERPRDPVPSPSPGGEGPPSGEERPQRPEGR